MAKQTKNLLTREACKKDLQNRAKAELHLDAVVLAAISLIFLPLVFMGIALLKQAVAIGIAVILVCITPPVIFIGRLISDIKRKRLADEERFSVVKDTVLCLSKGETPKKYSEGRHTVDVIYFTTYGRYVANGVTFDMASEGDEFYLVILHSKKDELCFAFHTMMYEYKNLLEDNR